MAARVLLQVRVSFWLLLLLLLLLLWLLIPVAPAAAVLQLLKVGAQLQRLHCVAAAV
jgi:hypothetical protein